MICLPTKAWNMDRVAGGGLFFIFQTTDERWFGLRIFNSDNEPLINVFGKDLDNKRKSVEKNLPKKVIEINPEDYRIIWLKKDRVFKVQSMTCDIFDQPSPY